MRIINTRNSTATQIYMPQLAAFSRTSFARFDSAVNASAVSSTCAEGRIHYLTDNTHKKSCHRRTFEVVQQPGLYLRLFADGSGLDVKPVHPYRQSIVS